MCGIVGYTGPKTATPILIDGLKRLEYRGYDSAGICLADKSLNVIRTVGKVRTLEDRVKELGLPTEHCGIAHTRWATHGAPSEANAHPHTDDKKQFAVVHNGKSITTPACARSSRRRATASVPTPTARSSHSSSPNSTRAISARR